MNKTKKIFVCEDDPGIVEVIKIILEGEGYSVECYTSGRNLVEAVMDKKPVLLLLDLWMPEMNGPDFIKKIRSKPATKNIPIILLSAATDLEQIAHEAKVPFLRKPFHIDDLIVLVKTIIK